jgi:adenylylsulfate kinase
MVIWLIGIAGSGKSTLGVELKEYLSCLNKESYIIDGDLVRDFFDNDLGYSKQDRMANIKRIILAAHLLSQNGIITIVCNISPFEELRQFARRKIRNYNEIFLNKDLKISQKEDVKDMYKKSLRKTDIVGIDIEFEEPQNSDLEIEVDKESVEDSLGKIIEYIRNKHPDVIK